MVETKAQQHKHTDFDESTLKSLKERKKQLESGYIENIDKLPKYEQIMEQRIRPSYPSPVKEQKRDENFENLVHQSLEHIFKLKHKSVENCFLGNPERWLNSEEDIVKRRGMAEVPKDPIPPSEIIEKLIPYFNGLVDVATPSAMENVNPPSSSAAVIASMFGNLFNASILEDDEAWNVVNTEIESIGMVSKLIGWDAEKTNGVFTFGGTGNYLYGIKAGLARVLGQDYRWKGLRENCKFIASDVGHYCKYSVADWTGLGMDNVALVKIKDDNSMDTNDLRKRLQDVHEKGEKVVAIVATIGTTDAFGIDDVEEIAKIRDNFVKENNLDYKPFVYCDSVIGWVWLFFKDYDFEKNPLEIDTKEILPSIKNTLGKVSKMRFADACGIDFHKTGFCHYNCSCIIFRDGKEFIDLLKRPSNMAQYLYHYSIYHPGEYTLECSRTASYSLAAWATLHTFGVTGYQAMVAHLLSVQNALRHELNSRQNIVVVNMDDSGFVTLFRCYPEGVDAKKKYKEEFENGTEKELKDTNDFNQEIANHLFMYRVHEKGPALSFTSKFRESKSNNPYPIAAIKIFPMSPYSNAEVMKLDVIPFIERAIKEVGKDHKKKRQVEEQKQHPTWLYPRFKLIPK
ncbi:hypothetical protein ABK040_012459 [Willaertia magna]